MKLRHATIPAIAATIALTAAACTVSEEVGKDNPPAISESPASKAVQEPVDHAIKELEKKAGDGTKDVTLKSCWLGDPYEQGDKVPIVDLSVKNSGAKVADYWVDLEITDTHNKRIETLYASASRVAPGQTVDTGKGDGEEDVNSTASETIPGPIKCRVLDVDRTLSTE